MAPNRTRRRLLATGATIVSGSLGGCVLFGGGGGGSAGQEQLTVDGEQTIVNVEHGTSAGVRTVRHTPSQNTAYIEGAIKVPREAEYEVRLGVIDQSDVVLAQEIITQDLYTTGANLVSTELEVGDCGACHSGLVDVSLSERALRRIEQEQEQQQQRQDRMQQQEQQQSQNSSTDGQTVSANETEGSV